MSRMVIFCRLLFPVIFQQEMSYTVSEEQIEQDELNQHECMLPLMKLIDHMQHNKITPEVPQVLHMYINTVMSGLMIYVSLSLSGE